MRVSGLDKVGSIWYVLHVRVLKGGYYHWRCACGATQLKALTFVYVEQHLHRASVFIGPGHPIGDVLFRVLLLLVRPIFPENREKLIDGIAPRSS